MNTTDVLRQAKELLSDERRWLHNGDYYAADSNGECRDPRDACAVQWCAIGAVARVSGTDYLGGRTKDPARVVLDAVAGNIIALNDHPKTTHADVIDAFDRALLLVAGDTPVEENVGKEVPVAA